MKKKIYIYIDSSVQSHSQNICCVLNSESPLREGPLYIKVNYLVKQQMHCFAPRLKLQLPANLTKGSHGGEPSISFWLKTNYGCRRG